MGVQRARIDGFRMARGFANRFWIDVSFVQRARIDISVVADKRDPYQSINLSL